MPPPIFHRQFLDGIIDLPIHLSFPYDEMFPSQQQLIDQSSTESFRFPTFHFPKEKVLQLKAKANAEMGTNNISSLQSLLAHFWRATIRNTHDLNPDQEVFLFHCNRIETKIEATIAKWILWECVSSRDYCEVHCRWAATKWDRLGCFAHKQNDCFLHIWRCKKACREFCQKSNVSIPNWYCTNS